MTIRRLAQLRTPAQFEAHLHQLGLALDFEPQVLAAPDSPLAQPGVIPPFPRPLANRWCILPMEGWDGTLDGAPTELVTRRWQHFGHSGAKLIWGGEAVAVRAEGRANPHQLIISEGTLPHLAALRERLVQAHAEQWDPADLVIGLQLTHSGRFCRPSITHGLEPRILYPHPVLNAKFGLPDDYPVFSDDDLRRLIDDYIQAGRRAQRAGFDFVDVKHCHGYLGHELLSAVERPGDFGGSFENRTRFLREVVAGLRAEAPGLEIGVRLSAFDFRPFQPDPAGGPGIPTPLTDPHYAYAFGGDGTGGGIDLTEPHRFLELLQTLGIHLVNITAGSPYYTPHIQRPALFPPSDGYPPPEDPLVGVARLIAVTAELKQRHSGLIVVGSGYSYLQEWLPHVAQAVLRQGKADFIGLGRLVLSYPEFSADVLAGRPLQRQRLCRTFSDCTTAPRKGLVSGCYPLDPYYRERPEARQLPRFQAPATPPQDHS